MEYWRAPFANRQLSKAVFLAVRWTNLVELQIALHIRREFSRLRLLGEIDVDFDRLDDEAER